MLSKRHRLPGSVFSADLGHKSGNVFRPAVRDGLFSVKMAPSPLTVTRFGVIVGKNIDKRAAKRNHLKRIVYNWLQKNIVYFQGGRDILIIVLPYVKNLRRNDIEKSLSGLLLSKLPHL